MKKNYFILITAAVLVFTSTVVMAIPANENAINSQASLKVINPIVLTETADLNFGTMGVGWGGTVSLSPETNERTANNAVYLLSDETEHVANYSISGAPNSSYIVTFDASFDVVNADDDALTVFPSIYIASKGQLDEHIGVLDEEGTDNFNIGGYVNFSAGTKNGDYHGGFNVTVNYN